MSADAPAKAKPERRRRTRQVFLAAVIAFLLYLGIGALAPFSVHPEVNFNFQADFDRESFYSTGSTERAALVADNQDALDIRLRMIAEAKERIILANFDIRDCESGRDIAAALLMAAARGVDVQILSDGMNGLLGMSGSPAWLALGRLPNVEIRYYNTPNVLLPWTFNGRMHDKYILVDHRLLLLGGRNTFDKFLGGYVSDREKSRDLEVLVYSPDGAAERSAMAQVEAYFSSLWNGPDVKPHLEGDFLRRGAADRAEAELRARYEALAAARPGLCDSEPTDYTPYTVPIESAVLIHNPTGILSKEPRVWWQIQQLMEGAEERVTLQTPYAVCNEPMYAGLEQVAAKGLPFEVQLNSTGVGDNFMASSDYTHNKERVLATGAEIWEWYGDCSSHAKSVLIDDDLALVGSYNLDMRSTYIDTELMLAVHGEEFNDLLEAYLDGMKRDSLRATGRETYAEKPGVETRDNGDWKHRLFPITSVLFQPFRYLL